MARLKKLLYLTLFFACSFSAVKSQTITDTTTLRSVINTKIVPNGAKLISATDMNRILNGLMDLWNPDGFDSAYFSHDTLILRRNNPPSYPNLLVKIPTSTLTSLAGLSDVQLNSLLNGQFLVYNSGTGKWNNVTLVAANGLNFVLDTMRLGGTLDRNTLITGGAAIHNYGKSLTLDSLATFIVNVTDSATGAKSPFLNLVYQNPGFNYVKLGIQRATTIDSSLLYFDPAGGFRLINDSSRILLSLGSIKFKAKQRYEFGDSNSVNPQPIYLYGFKNNSTKDSVLATDSVGKLVLVNNNKIDSVRRKAGSDSVFQYSHGVKTFAYHDSVGTGGGGGGGSNLNGNRPITRDFSTVTGVNLGTIGDSATLEALLYPSQNPTSSLTVTFNAQTGTNLSFEKAASGSSTATLNWTAGRLASTQPLNTIFVATVGQSFSQPPAPGSVSGTQSVAITINTNVSWSNVVTTSDGKTATSNASISWQNKWFYGFSSSNVFSNALVQGLNNFFSLSRTQGDINMGTPSGAQYGWIAFDQALDPGNIDQIWVNGLDQTGQFTRSVVSYTNASGFVTNYVIYIQNTPTSSGYIFQVH